MKQTIEIEVPEGKEAIWKDGKVFFIDKKPELPKTWEEFCETHEIQTGEAYITNGSLINIMHLPFPRGSSFDANLLPSEQDAKAHLALMKLHQLRDCYRQGWKPDWKSIETDKYCIINCGRLSIMSYTTYVRFLSFQSIEIAQQFLDNFRDLIEEAGDLI